MFDFEDRATSNNVYGFDRNGNLTRDDNRKITLVTYNDPDLPQRVRAGDVTMEFVYDAAGNKLSQSDGAKTIEYVGDVLYEEGVLSLFFSEGRVLTPTGNPVYQYHVTDHLGNVRTVVHSNNTVFQRHDFYPFGMIMDESLGSDRMSLYQGKEFYGSPGWYDFHARMYDPALGRFLSVDPQNQFASPYTGMGNNPIIGIDPDGEWAFLIPIAIGATMNVISNWSSISSAGSFGKGLGVALGYAGVGALQGASTLIGGPAGFALGGAIGGLGNGLMQGVSGNELWANAGVGAVSGLLGGVSAQGAGKLVGDMASPLLDGLVKGAVGGAAGGFVGGGVASSMMGESFWTGAWQGAKSGAIIGGTIGGAVSSYQAYKDGFNPLTGKKFGSQNLIDPVTPMGSSTKINEEVTIDARTKAKIINKVPEISSNEFVGQLESSTGRTFQPRGNIQILNKGEIKYIYRDNSVHWKYGPTIEIQNHNGAKINIYRFYRR